MATIEINDEDYDFIMWKIKMLYKKYDLDHTIADIIEGLILYNEGDGTRV